MTNPVLIVLLIALTAGIILVYALATNLTVESRGIHAHL
jgi:hypothetical protein